MTQGFLDIVLVNRTGASILFAHITGRRLQPNGVGAEVDVGPIMIKSDGMTPHMLASGGGNRRSPGVDHGIRVGGPGAKKRVRIPRLAGGRVYFSKNRPLTFYVNSESSGPALVEPSPMNPADTNYGVEWTFAELTFNQAEVYANISYVDFLNIPVALHLSTHAGPAKEVTGMPKGAITRIAKRLEELGNSWGKLVVRSPSGALIRILSPNSGEQVYPGLFKGFFREHVDAVWKHYENTDLIVDTQRDWGVFRGRVSGGVLKLRGKDGWTLTYEKPTTKDILTCNTGPFALREPRDEKEEARLNVGARIAAAFNRGTLLINPRQPHGERVETYYTQRPINHYARLCHKMSVAHRGYAFPYDDVSASGKSDQSGYVSDGNPKLLTVTAGGLREGHM
ncbi:hypothetical protein AK830_g313 [Neonectria ditissima]|uniref:GH64 domain-containing protein n=1 Tax=Neonectria ditissima TaxID=78410 RepID=A0A0P7BWH5_9HYPO|nr:hypothetical protein AK830_g313 [Neonectria ditissima]